MTFRRALALAVVLLAGLSQPARAFFFDHAALDNILRHYVDEDGAVDYAAVRENSLTALESYFNRLAEADMAGWPVPERLAFWINAYNARVIYEIAQRPKMKKVSEDFELFNKPFKIAGQRLTLNDIEHRILRAAKNRDNGLGPIPGVSLSSADVRIHYALVRGTVSCPKLLNSAYKPETIDDILNVNERAYVNNTKYIAIEEDHLRMSSIFKWYAADFKAAGGVPAYLDAQLLTQERGDAEAVKALLSIAFQKTNYAFDWTVNAQGRATTATQPTSPGGPILVPPDALSTSHPELKGY